MYTKEILVQLLSSSKTGPVSSIFPLIEHTLSKYSHDMFYIILNTRLEQTYQIDPSTKDLNIAGIFSTNAYKSTFQTPVVDWPEDYLLFEKIAVKYCQNWAMFWCEYEIYKIKARYQENKSTVHTVKLPIDERCYSSSVIQNVANTQDRYFTLYHNQPMLLKDAISLINLSTFVAQDCWFEMLGVLDLSKTGCHFILHYEDQSLSHPFIVASAKIQTWHDSSQWLYFAPFFMADNWQLCLPEDFESKCKHLGVFTPDFQPKLESSISFDKHFWDSLWKKESACEVLRLTVSGNMQQRSFYLFLAQKLIMQHLDSRGIILTYTVIEQPWMIHFYETLMYGGYFHSSCKDINDTGRYTYKGFWIVPNLRKELDITSFKDYKRRVINRKKELETS